MSGDRDAPLVVGLGGSTGPSSVSSALLGAALARAQAAGARTRTVAAPALAALPIYAGGTDAAATDLLEAVRAADAVIIATPGYHGGMSGLVKNALDHLEALRADPRPYLDGRAVGVIVAAAGWQATGTALVSVRSAVHALRGWPSPFGVTINSAEQRPGPDGRFDAQVEGALAIMVGQLLEFAGWQAAARRITAPAPEDPSAPAR